MKQSYKIYRFSRESFIKDIIQDGDLYPKMPLYKMFRIIQIEHPELSNEDIIIKYFDPFKGHILSTIEFKDKNSDIISFVYKSNNIPEEEQLISVGTCNGYLEYSEHGTNFYTKRYTIETWWNKENHEKAIISNININTIIQSIETAALIQDINERNKYIGNLLYHITIKGIYNFNIWHEALGLFDEYGYTKERLLESANIIIREKQMFSHVYSSIDNTYYSNCCMTKLNHIFSNFAYTNTPCTRCNSHIYLYTTKHRIFYDTTEPKRIEICSGCRDPSKPTAFFSLDINNKRIYCHSLCSNNINFIPLKEFITYNDNLIIVSPIVKEMLTPILEFDFSMK